MLAELDGRLDMDRVHFVGWPPTRQYLAVLQSRLCVYLTYPFVLSRGPLKRGQRMLVVGLVRRRSRK
jgi:hypothetical protein